MICLRPWRKHYNQDRDPNRPGRLTSSRSHSHCGRKGQGLGGGASSPFSSPGTRVVLNILSNWAEHKGRIPISSVCRRPRAPEPGPVCSGTSSPNPRDLPYRWNLLLVQKVAVQEQGMGSIACPGSLQRCGRDIQEILLGGKGRGHKIY